VSLSSGITVLDINTTPSPKSSLDLSTLAKGFPQLRHLKVTIPSGLDGSLNSLKHLISLAVTVARTRIRLHWLFSQIPPNILPWESAETLRHLTIEHRLL
jgi:hypothetical protein